MYGGTNTGEDLKIQANDADTYPYMLMEGDSHIKLYSSDDIYFYDDSEQSFKFYLSGSTSYITGSDDAGDDLYVYANSAESCASLTLLGGSYGYISSCSLNVITTARIPSYDDVGSVRSAEMLNRMRQEFGHELWADPNYVRGDAHGEGDNAFAGGVLAPNGNVILVPVNSDYVGIYDPDTDTYSSGATHSEGNSAFIGGVLAPNGNVIFVPYNSDYIGIYDPDTDTYTQGDAHGEGGNTFIGGVLAPNGKVILVPRSSDYIGIEMIYAEVIKNTCLHPSFNKF